MKNTDKFKVGAYVWYRRRIKRITGFNIQNKPILDREVTINRKSVKLVNIGDNVQYVDLDILPPRCAEQSGIKVTGFSDSDCISTNVDASRFDDTDYRHFKKAK